ERAAQLGIEGPDSLTLAELTRRRAPSEPSVAALLSEYMENIAVGVAAMAQIIDPQIIVLHGDIAACDEETIGLLRARTHERVIPDLTDLPDIEVSPLDNRAALLGSAGLVLSETYQVQPWSTSPSRT
ncbi:MAG TPA: ROK family protein, partial [Acidimicrobiales bacterium]|nr:ROK family protein [Acidimicrobiales bacterium]